MSEETKLIDAQYVREMMNPLMGDYVPPPEMRRHNERLEAIAKKLETMDAKPSSPVDLDKLAGEIASEIDDEQIDGRILQSYMKKIILSALLKAQSAAVKEGMVLVPIEPTSIMVKQGKIAYRNQKDAGADTQKMIAGYKAMIAAAQKKVV